MKQPIPKTPMEILVMLGFLERERNNCIIGKCLSGALAMGSQIRILKWAFNLLEENEN